MKLQDAEERQGDDDVPCNPNSLCFILGALQAVTQNLVVSVTFNLCVSSTNTKYGGGLFGHQIPNLVTDL